MSDMTDLSTETRDLSRRERQIMDLLFRVGRATAAEVMDGLPDAPSYSAVRALLREPVDRALDVSGRELEQRPALEGGVVGDRHHRLIAVLVHVGQHPAEVLAHEVEVVQCELATVRAAVLHLHTLL